MMTREILTAGELNTGEWVRIIGTQYAGPIVKVYTSGKVAILVNGRTHEVYAAELERTEAPCATCGQFGGVNGSCHEAACPTCGETTPDGTCPDCAPTFDTETIAKWDRDNVVTETEPTAAEVAEFSACCAELVAIRDTTERGVTAAYNKIQAHNEQGREIVREYRQELAAEPIGNFIAYLAANGYHIAEYTTGDDGSRFSAPANSAEVLQGYIDTL